MARGRHLLCIRLAVMAALALLRVPPALAQESAADTQAPAHGSDTGAAPDGTTAPDASPPGAGAARTVEPPTLIEAAEATYPEEARAAGQEGRVVLRLTIDAEGRVTEAEITEPAGHGFDEAAREAVPRFRFAPALRAGKPVASRILYAHEFRLPRPPPMGILAGRVLLPGSGADPAAGVEVVLTATDGSSHSARADEQGRFRVEALSPGPYDIIVEALGIGRITARTEVIAAQTAETTLRLVPLPVAQSVEVTVRGASDAERLRRSAQAVRVIETKEARRRTADLGEVMARSEGVGVRREGGLGSGTRFSLNGLTGDQIRFFLDEVPLDLSGYPFGIANVPVNLVERVELYRGVVPARFGADALGGAVNLVTDQDTRGSHAAASFQVGPFSTYRLTVGAHHLHEPSGRFARVNGFFDSARNDYPIDVQVPDENGRLSSARVYRFHDRYHAAGAGGEVGFVRRPWADRLLVRAFYARHDKDVQHNGLMTVPYGEVTYGKRSGGAHVRYAQRLFEGARLDAVAGYTYVQTVFRDLSTCRYDWFGRCAWPLPQPGEIESRASDDIVHQHSTFARLNLTWIPASRQIVRFSVAPNHANRTGKNRALPDEQYDPLTAERALSSGVAAVEHETRPLDDRLANIAFVKTYLQLLRTKEQLPSGLLRDLDVARHRMGIGDSLRYTLTEALYVKASYEYATRLPNPEEMFGNGGWPIVENLHLEPEVSHNVNLGVILESTETPVGHFRLTVNGFGRLPENLIWLAFLGDYSQYKNAPSARSMGFESSAGWTSPGGLLSLEGNFTWEDFRNTSSERGYNTFRGDRIPNRPYLFADAGARVEWPGVALPSDALSLTWSTRYVHAFFRGWESAGDPASKLLIPSQLSHSVALTYLVEHVERSVSATIEVQNLTDERLFDFFGVQRPGRAAYAKLVLEL